MGNGQAKVLKKEDIRTQYDFENYINKLPEKERCVFMTGLDLDLCTDFKHDCRFRGDETYSLVSGRRKECKRPKVLRYKKLLGK